MNPNDVYRACFCPHCGSHLNEDELDWDYAAKDKPIYGSWFTCGWCNERHNDYSHIRRCRETIHVRERLAREARTLDLRLMLLELDVGGNTSSVDDQTPVQVWVSDDDGRHPLP